MKRAYIGYSVLFFAVCLIPFAGMLLPADSGTSENRTLAEAPVLKDEDGWNTEFLSDAGAYFQDHFGFRQQLVTMNALVQGKVFGVSAAESVIQGTDGWLYYKDSLDDYLGQNLMSGRALFNVAHSLRMMQDHVEGQGASFLFTVAPNKNSLYGEHMPWYDSRKVSDEKNLTNLLPYLEEEGVHYADLYGLFRSAEGTYYHARDSHWNNVGAAMAASAMMDALGKEHPAFTETPGEVRRDFTGDLDQMLYPLALTPEEETYYDSDVFAYVGEVESNFDPHITTVNPSAEGSLLMYRDSFGNALLPFFANSYGNAYFSRGVPYQLTDLAAHQADTVIAERAERFLPDMAQNPPQITASLMLPEGGVQESQAEVKGLEAVQMGTQVKISGVVDEAFLEEDSRICVQVEGNAYEAFPATLTVDGESSDGGFVVYLPAEGWIGGSAVEILVQKGGMWYKIYEETL